MIRPCPNATIPRGAYVCHFAIGQPPSTAPPSDYVLSSTRRGSLLVYDPLVYDGHNIGWFINQGGLLEGLRELVAASDRDRGCTAQRNHYPETGCNGAPSLSIKTDFHVNFTETFSDGIRVFMNGNRRTLPHGTASSTIIDAWSLDTSNSFRIQKMSGK